MEIEREVNKYINFVKEQNSSMVKFAISCLKASGFKIDWNDITVNDNGIIEFKPDFMRSFENNNDGNDIIAREDTIIYYLGDLNSSDKEMSKLYVDKYKTLTP
ncbi:MAG: hypothetical protein LBC92_04280 [Rickettsiales bacterium]|jgi:hypothetical protein|nr:hypothetical protein [Rickettsiales bacterium]